MWHVADGYTMVIVSMSTEPNMCLPRKLNHFVRGQVGRHGAMMAGLQVRPGSNGCLCNPRALMGDEPWRLWSELRGASSLAVAYSPAAGTPGVKEAPLCQLGPAVCGLWPRLY